MEFSGFLNDLKAIVGDQNVVHHPDDLLVFEYDGEAVGQSVLKYKKKPYFPKKIIDMINDAGNQPFQPLHQALKRHLDSI